jgi:DNA-binding NarL/FixJ family response regulator
MDQLKIVTKSVDLFDQWVNATPNAQHTHLSELPCLENPANESCIYLIRLSECDEHALRNFPFAEAKVLLFSDFPNPTEAFEWFKLGIKGYLNTHAVPERIQHALQTIADNHVWLGQNVMNALIEQSSKLVSPSKGWQKLVTEREHQTLNWVMTGKSNREIAEIMHISERTVKAHVSKLLEKFQVSDRLGLVLKIQNWQE